MFSLLRNSVMLNRSYQKQLRRSDGKFVDPPAPFTCSYYAFQSSFGKNYMCNVRMFIWWSLITIKQHLNKIHKEVIRRPFMIE